MRDATGLSHRIVGISEDITETTHASLAEAKAQAEVQSLGETVRTLQDKMITMCAWTKQIEHEGKWISFEEFLHRSLQIKTSHGMSPEIFGEWTKKAAAEKRTDVAKRRQSEP